MTSVSFNLPDHLSKIARGWGDAGEIQVVQFPDQPPEGRRDMHDAQLEARSAAYESRQGVASRTARRG